MKQSGCEAIFGNRDQVIQNGEWRKSNLYDFQVNDEGWTIIHRVAEWTTPKAMHFADMALVRTQTLGDEEIAVVRFSGKWAERCGEEHIVKRDMSLGTNTQVLSVSKGIVLLDRDGVLESWASEKAPLPARTQMVWRSGYSIVLAGGGSTARAPGSKKASKKAASSAAKRRAKARKNKKKK